MIVEQEKTWWEREAKYFEELTKGHRPSELPAPAGSVIVAAEHMDWMKVILNQGPPCFHVADDGRFCGRAERWDGHYSLRNSRRCHKFVSLADLIRSLSPNEKAKQ